MTDNAYALWTDGIEHKCDEGIAGRYWCPPVVVGRVRIRTILALQVAEVVIGQLNPGSWVLLNSSDELAAASSDVLDESISHTSKMT